MQIPYSPPFIEGTERSLRGESASYIGVDFGPTHFIARRLDIFEPDGRVRETIPTEVFRFTGYNRQTKKSTVVPETSEGLVKMVVDAIKQQVPKG